MANDYSQITSLISKVHSLTSDYLKSQLEQEKLPEFVSSHGNILFQLSRVDKLTMTELSQKINRDKSTTTVLVRKLLLAHLVERDKSTEDNRVVYIKLSKYGQEYTNGMGVISKKLNETVYQGFTEEEKETINNLLKKIERNFVDELRPAF